MKILLIYLGIGIIYSFFFVFIATLYLQKRTKLKRIKDSMFYLLLFMAILEWPRYLAITITKIIRKNDSNIDALNSYVDDINGNSP